MTSEYGVSRDWLRPLIATMLVQVTSAFLSRLVPTIAPVLHEERGISEALIGYLAAFATVGSIAFLLAGGPMMRRYGPIRSLQLGMIASGLGIILIAAPTTAVLFVGMILVGLGYGPSAPAGTEVLQRYAPARHRNLIFSVKQAGVPIGGVLAGLILPAIVGALDWRFTLVFAALIVAASVAAVSKDSRASTSVLTRPGTSFRISSPKRTSTRSTTSSSGRPRCAATVSASSGA